MSVFSVSRFTSFIFLVAFSMIAVQAGAQNKIIMGQIRDQHSAEPVPFASVQFKFSGTGRLADSAGGFLLFVPSGTRDTLQITSVGYQDYSLPINASTIKGDTLH